MTRRSNSLDSEITELREEFEDKVKRYADEYRLQVLIPFCRMHRVTFASGMGSWSFYDRKGEPRDAKDQGFKYLKPIEEDLWVKVTGASSLGHYVSDVDEEDLL